MDTHILYIFHISSIAIDHSFKYIIYFTYSNVIFHLSHAARLRGEPNSTETQHNTPIPFVIISFPVAAETFTGGLTQQTQMKLPSLITKFTSFTAGGVSAIESTGTDVFSTADELEEAGAEAPRRAAS